MKKQRYIVEIEMPDGDFISAGWLKDLIQTDCDVEGESRQKVTVQETSLPSNLDEAAEEYEHKLGYYECMNQWPSVAFRAGAEWMAGQGVTLEGRVCKDEYAAEVPFYYVETENSDDLPLVGDKVVVQIRKK